MTHRDTVPIVWNESYSVGIGSLDHHHKHLAHLINQLADHSSDDQNSEKIVDILSALINYAEYHFRQEEELMAATDYSELEPHREEHKHFCEVIAETCYDATVGAIGTRDLFNYLTRWWKNHILHEDMKYKPHLTIQTHGVSAR